MESARYIIVIGGCCIIRDGDGDGCGRGSGGGCVEAADKISQYGWGGGSAGS